jgi:hypothetical protein
MRGMREAEVFSAVFSDICVSFSYFKNHKLRMAVWREL